MPANATREATLNLVNDGFVKIPEAATFLSLSRASIYKLMDDGLLAYAKLGRCRRVPKRALIEYAERQLVQR